MRCRREPVRRLPVERGSRCRGRPAAHASGAASAANYSFSDSRLEEMVFRYRARNFPETLNDVERARWTAHVAGRHGSTLPGARTQAWLRTEVARLVEAADAGKKKLLEDVLRYAGRLV